MEILICDDNGLFAEKLEAQIKRYCAQHDWALQCHRFTSAEELLRSPQAAQAQAAFLDVEMAPCNGIELGRRLKQHNPEIVLVYISAYLEFAPEGYTVNAFRYLLKRNLEATLPVCLDELQQKCRAQAPVLRVPQRREYLEFPYRVICYLESDLRRINLYGAAGEQPLCTFYGKLSALEPELAPYGFLRIERSYLVNLAQVHAVRNYTVTMSNGAVLSASRKRYSELRSRYLEYRGRFL